MANNNNTTMLPPDTSGSALTHSKRRCFTGFPPGALDGCQPTLQFRGGALGFGDDRPDVLIGFGDQVGIISAELALFHLDRFTKSGRAQLLLMAGYHYGVPLERPATTMEGGAV